MQNRHSSILNAINNSSGKYNILKAPTHESFESNWASMPHTFYMIQKEGFKTWNGQYRKMPHNHVLLNGQNNQIPIGLNLDIALSQNKFGQFQALYPLSQMMNIPLISLEHTLPMPHWDKKQMEAVKNMRGNINVFISKYSIDKWGFSLDDPSVRVIYHGIDIDKFKPDPSVKKENRAFAVCNDFINRDRICGFQEWQQLVDGFPNKIMGDTPGLSEPTKSVEELINEYNKSMVFVNTTLISPIPTVVLEAMACGVCILTLDNCMLPEVIQDGYNGYISNDINYLREKLDYLLKHEDVAAEMGKNARKTIEEKFSLNIHINEWLKIFDEVYGKGR